MNSHQKSSIGVVPTFDGLAFQKDPFEKLSSVLRGEKQSTKLSFHLVAVSTLHAASKNEALRNVLQNGILICDSTPIAKFINLRQGEFSVCRGADFFRFALNHKPNQGGHFLLGGSKNTLSKLSEHIRKEYPDIQIVGKFSPPFEESIDLNEILTRIQSTKPCYVWVGMGSPKQDFIAEEISRRTGLTTFAVGAAFDFLSGAIFESPKFLRGSGLEWLYRLCLEPKRLWKRYFFGNYYFIKVAFRTLLGI